MELTSLYTAVITTIAVFGSAGAWRYYEKRVMAKEKAELAHKDDCRDRITKLEALLEHSGDEKDSMRKANYSTSYFCLLLLTWAGPVLAAVPTSRRARGRLPV